MVNELGCIVKMRLQLHVEEGWTQLLKTQVMFLFLDVKKIHLLRKCHLEQNLILKHNVQSNLKLHS